MDIKIDIYDYHKFEIYSDNKQWHYKIHTAGCMPYDDGLIESDEWYDSEGEAKDAAIKHIDLLTSGG